MQDLGGSVLPTPGLATHPAPLAYPARCTAPATFPTWQRGLVGRQLVLAGAAQRIREPCPRRQPPHQRIRLLLLRWRHRDCEHEVTAVAAGQGLGVPHTHLWAGGQRNASSQPLSGRFEDQSLCSTVGASCASGLNCPPSADKRTNNHNHNAPAFRPQRCPAGRTARSPPPCCTGVGGWVGGGYPNGERGE